MKFILTFAFAVLAAASSDAATTSGGAATTVGTLRNTGSAGSPFATGLRNVGTQNNHTGLIPLLFPAPTVPTNADSDGDGLPDAWETANGFDPNASNPLGTDTDGDGLTDAQEYAAGTNPRSASSRFKAVSALDPGGLHLDFPTVAGRTYRLESSPDLATWTTVEDIPGDGSPKSRTRPIPTGPGQKVFYRLSIIFNP